MAQIKAGLSNVRPGTVEVAVRREWQQGRLLRVAPGVYRLAPPKPPEDGHTEEEWFAALEAWVVDHTSWDTERLGPQPDDTSTWSAPEWANFLRSATDDFHRVNEAH
jgi:hypothetical protein